MMYSYPYPDANYGLEPRDLISPQAIVMAGISLVLLVTAVVSDLPGVFAFAALTAVAAALFSVVHAIRSISRHQFAAADAERSPEHV